MPISRRNKPSRAQLARSSRLKRRGLTRRDQTRLETLIGKALKWFRVTGVEK